MRTQDGIFEAFEGDNYFQRKGMSNRSDEERIKEDLPLKLIVRNKLRFKNVAEVGLITAFVWLILSKSTLVKQWPLSPH